MNNVTTIVLLLIVIMACSERDKTSEGQIKTEYSSNVNNEINLDTSVIEPTASKGELIQKLVNQKFKNYKIDELIDGDLNNDGRVDVFAILSKKCSQKESVLDGAICYRAVLFLSNDNNKYSVARSNDQIISCSECQNGDPEVEINNGVISITKAYGACWKDIITESYVFDGRDNWLLKKVEKSSINCNAEPVNGEIPIISYPSSTDKDFGVIKI